jgi:hypothetical protein
LTRYRTAGSGDLRALLLISPSSLPGRISVGSVQGGFGLTGSGISGEPPGEFLVAGG